MGAQAGYKRRRRQRKKSKKTQQQETAAMKAVREDIRRLGLDADDHCAAQECGEVDTVSVNVSNNEYTLQDSQERAGSVEPRTLTKHDQEDAIASKAAAVTLLLETTSPDQKDDPRTCIGSASHSANPDGLTASTAISVPFPGDEHKHDQNKLKPKKKRKKRIKGKEQKEQQFAVELHQLSEPQEPLSPADLKAETHTISQGKSAAQPQDASIDALETFVIRATPGKGLGVFAARDIRRGTRIMSESPLLTIPPNFNGVDVYDLFVNISPSQKRQFMELHAANISERSQNLTSSLSEYYEQLPEEIRASAVKNHVRMLDIIFTNAFGLDCSSGRQGVFPKASRMNHSCVPNACRSWNADKNQLIVHALRDIPAGDEITVSYVVFCLGIDARQAQLRQFYGFTCCCPACQPDTPFGAASVSRRERMVELQRLRAGLGFKHPSKALKAAEELIVLLKEEGLENFELDQAYHEAAMCSERIGELRKAWQYAERSADIRTCCYGSEDSETRDAVRYMECLKARASC